MQEPVSLLISQYHYLKHTHDAGFYEEMKGTESLEDYLGFAIKNGQDNLLARYLSFIKADRITDRSKIKDCCTGMKKQEATGTFPTAS